MQRIVAISRISTLSSREQIFKRATEFAEKPYVPAADGSDATLIPKYDGSENSQDPWVRGEPNVKAPAYERKSRPLICDNVTELFGNTPMVRLTRLAKELGLENEILGKCEFLSAGGSIKDRIALRMIEDAEKPGKIKPGDVLIEPTSGNTGIGMCVAAAVKGYHMIITMPKKMSGEKINTMKALGALILRTESNRQWDDPESHIGLAFRLQKSLDRAHVLDQYINPGNPLAHYNTTAEEILEQTGGNIDYLFVTAGTGGTVTGISRKLKECGKNPNLKVVGIDPHGSILALPEDMNNQKRGIAYHVEGIGYDFIPTSLDRKAVDEWLKTDDDESFAMSLKIIQHEGLMCGGSSGAAMVGCFRYLKAHPEETKNKRCVVLLPDGTRNYMSKFLSPDWLQEQNLSQASNKDFFK